MQTEVMLPNEMQSLKRLVEDAEQQRDDQYIDKLITYLNQCPELFPLTRNLAEGLFEKLIHYFCTGHFYKSF